MNEKIIFLNLTIKGSAPGFKPMAHFFVFGYLDGIIWVKVKARMQNSKFSFSSFVTPMKKYHVILGQVSRNTLPSIT